MRLVLTLYRVSNALVYDLESAVHRPEGLSWAGFRVLFTLWLGGPMESKRAAELSGMSRAALSAVVGTLKKDGLVVSEQGERDRRSMVVSLTDDGLAVIVRTFRSHNKREQEWAGSLTEPEVSVLIGLLRKLAAGTAAADAKKRF
jgi:DNA-binding MarR family transcriptional regulator